jgi:predicted nucleic acid-binding protein
MALKKELGEGSISSITLAIENPNSLFLTDDYEARNYAINIGLNVIGSTSVLSETNFIMIGPYLFL